MAEAVIRLTERTREQSHAFFRTLEQDPALFARPEEFTPYVYDPEEVDARLAGRLPGQTGGITPSCWVTR